MNQSPNCGPDAQSFESAYTRAQALHNLTQAILAQSANPDLPTLGQMVLQRGLLLEEIAGFQLADFTPEEQARLNESLQASKQLDTAIEQNMRAFQTAIDGHLKELKDTKSLLGKYKLPGSDSQSTRSREA